MEPVEFGKYLLLHRLAWGGMAELFLATPRDDVDKILVIKLVARRFAEDDTFSSMFVDESRIATLLDHPNICRIVDVGRVGPRHYLVMEYLHGKDLRTICRRSLDRYRRAIPLGIAVRVGLEVTKALTHAHSARATDGTPLNIIHRDVSPSNVMLTYDGQVKLVDFGIAKAANRVSLTQPGLIKGKLRYLSPEQALGKPIDHRCDIFILGTTLWECSIGRHLFDGKEEAQIYQAISEGRVRSPSTLVPNFPPELERILLRALSKEPDQRYPTAEAMRADLAEFARCSKIAGDSGKVLSGFLQELFDDEYSRWQSAKAAGTRLLDYLLQTSKTTPDLPVKLDDLTKPAEGGRRTLFFGEERPNLGASKTAKPTASAVGRIVLPSQTAAQAAAARSRSAHAVEHVVGGTKGVRVEPSDSGRPTVIDADELPTMPFLGHKDELTDPLSAVTEQQSPDPGEPASASPAQDPPPESDPFGGVSEVELAVKNRLPPGVKPDPNKLRTGDWAHQQLAEGKPRPGTHPFFKEKGGLLRGETLRIPRSVNPKIVVIALGVLALAGLLLTWWMTSHPDEEAAVAAPAHADSGAAGAVDAAAATTSADTARPYAGRLSLTTEPSGARVFDVESDSALGVTPLSIERSTKTRTLEFRLPRYRAKQVRIGPEAAAHHQKLLKARPTRRGPAKRRSKRDRLLDPFR